MAAVTKALGACRAGAILALLSLCVFDSAWASTECGDAGVTVQVLGSGGPVPDDARAGAGYLVWLDGKSRVLVDAGGGIFQRFGASGAKLEDLQHIAITHFHADHAADLAALIKGGYFSRRTEPLTISGPAEGGGYPSLRQFLTREFGGPDGSYAYLSGALDGSGGMFRLLPRQVDQREAATTTVSNENGIVVQAVGVDHGPVPALGYLVTVADYRIAFSGDMRGSRIDFWRMVEGADLLFMDHAVPQNAGPVASNLHATPDTIGRRAASSGVKHLVLSHLMQRSLASLQENIRMIRQHFKGTIDVADDLLCYAR